MMQDLVMNEVLLQIMKPNNCTRSYREC